MRLRAKLDAIEKAERAKLDTKLDEFLASLSDRELEQLAGTGETGLEAMSDDELIQYEEELKRRASLRDKVEFLHELKAWIAEHRAAQSASL